jgi:hypothetical protein
VGKIEERRPDKKRDQIDPRAIRRTFRWRPGHEPDYGEPSAGWQYIKWDYSERPDAPPDQAKGLGGGPEAFPCDRPGCGEIMRIVARKQPSEIIEGSDVIRLKEEYDRAAVNRDDIFLVACPKCGQRIQIPGERLKELRYRKLGRV